MKSSTTAGFRRQLAALPDAVRRQARKQFLLWLKNPQHPSLLFKPVGNYWSARVNRDVRVLGIRHQTEIVWFYIGSHDGCESRI